MCALLNKESESVAVTDLWWPPTPVDIIMNFKVNDSNHFLALEHKYVYSNSNYPGYRSPQGGKYSQIECMLREIDRVTAAGETELYQGLFDMQAERHFIVLDARGREIDEILT